MTRRSLTLIAGASLLALAAAPAHADTLQEALLRAYASNPTITGARAGVRVQDENVTIARAAGRPAAQTQGSYTENLRQAGNNVFAPKRQLNAQAQVSYPILTFGAVTNTVRAAERRVEGARANLRGTEADLFTDVVAAYMDVIRDEAIVALNRQNLRVLEVNVQASSDRFEVGDLTRTDVAQSEARRALAEGQLRQAEARLIASRETYIRVVGAPPVELAAPPPLPNLPADPGTAVTVALDDNPLLEAAAKSRDASRFDVSAARTQRLPRVNLQAGSNYYNFLGSLGTAGPISALQSDYGYNVGVGVTLPLYQGGEPGARVRQAQARQAQAIEQLTDTERAVIAQTRSAYANWQSAQQVIASSQIAVDANKLSLEGVRAENSVGTRTILDILNAEQELLNSQVTLVTARRDAYVAGFALLAAMGRAEARDLGLEGGPLYDPVANFQRVRGKISDWSDDPEPRPVGTSTATTPAQTPVVGPNPLLDDPALKRPVDTNPANPAGNRR